jgi:PAS domain S-box-containing protein
MLSPLNARRSHDSQASLIASGATIALGIVVIFGWYVGSATLISIEPGAVPMNPATAILFILAGLAVLRIKSRRFAWLCAATILVVALLRLISYLAGWEFGPDALLFRDKLSAFPNGPNRMAPNTALGFVLLAVAISAAAGGAGAATVRTFAAIAAIPALLSLSGNLLGPAPLYGVTIFIPMAVPTGVGFIIICFALISLPFGEDRAAAANPAPRPLERKIAVGFASAVFMLGITGVVAYRNVHGSVANRRAGERSSVVSLSLSQALSSLQDLQVAQLRFITTGSDTDLRNFQAAGDAVMPRIQNLEDLLAGEPDQLKSALALEHLAGEELAAVQQAAQLRQTDGFAAARNHTGDDRQLMEQIRAVVQQMQDREATEMQQRTGLEYASARQTIAVIYCACGLSFLLVAAAGWTIRRDIAARQCAEEERDRFFNISLDMLCIADFDGYFKRVNPAFSRVLGWTREELLSRPFCEFVHPDDVQATLNELDGIAAGKNSIEFENRYRCKDGTYRWLSWAAVPVVEQRRIYAAARDATDRKVAEQQIRNLNQQLIHHSGALEETTRELEAFSYSVSHDLRAPLRSIDGFSQALLEDQADALDDDGKDCLNRVRAAAQRMAQLIDDMLSLSRVSRTEIKHDRTDLAEMARSIVAELRGSQPDRVVEVTIPPTLFAGGDARLLRIVLDNLLANAWKFTGKTAAARIELGESRQDGEAIYFVRDNGAGFDMAYVDKLFGAFQRLHDVTDFAGTGIGLATVQRIIHRHGGRVWAVGEIGKGAAFYFTLPDTPVEAKGRNKVLV